MSPVDVSLIVVATLACLLLIYDDAAWALATGAIQVAVWFAGLFAAVGVVAGALGYAAGVVLT